MLKTLAGLIALGVTFGPALAQTREVTGKGGFLSEWELKGTLTGRDTASGRAFSGPVVWKHLAICGPNERAEMGGDMSYEITRAGILSRTKVTISFEGAQCAFSGNFSDNMTGYLDCPNVKGVPLSLSVR